MTILTSVITQNSEKFIKLPKEFSINSDEIAIEAFDEGLLLRRLPATQSVSQNDNRTNEVLQAFKAFGEIDNFFGNGRVDLPPQTRDF